MRRRPLLFGSAVLMASVACLLTMRSLNSGFATDDHFMRAVFSGFTEIPEYARPTLATFVFSDGSEEANRALMDRGVFPWWTVPHARLAFWRPLASLSHYADFRIWGDNAKPMHAENMLLYALICALAVALYSRFLEPPWVAVFAALVFTIDENSGQAVGWISNRNMLMAAGCVMLVLIAHDAWRRQGWKPGAVLGPMVLAFGFLCAEAVVAAGGYLFAYALFMDRSAYRRRAATLAPYAVVFVVWYAYYRHSGYGSSGSSWYTDPGGDPVGFARALATHIPILLTNLAFMWPAPLLNRFDSTQLPLIVALFCVLLGGVVWILRPMLKHDAASRFWLLGLVLALFPVAAVVPQPRVVLIAGIGFAPLVARYLSAWATPRQWIGFFACLTVCAILAISIGIPALSFWAQAAIIGGALVAIIAALLFSTKGAEWMPSSRAWRAIGGALALLWVAFHLIGAPVALPGSSMMLGIAAKKMERAYASIPQDPDVRERTVIVLQAPSDFMPWHFSLIRASLQIPYPGHLRVLSSGKRDVTVEVLDAHTLVLRAERSLIGNPGTSVFRGPANPMGPGEKVRLAGMTVQVLEVDNAGFPQAAEFRFDDPLDSPSMNILGAGQVPFKLEKVGRYIKTESYVTIPLPSPGTRVSLHSLVEASPEYRSLMPQAGTP
ncbi:MAG: hypothetical protein IT364_14545 [Candidatus Hydrogenedentes bacterium]|nr:hypothetical protein [Candidatus Hydrogenedentota bacterium]